MPATARRGSTASDPLAAPLASLVRGRPPLVATPDAPLLQALLAMQQRRVGSVLVAQTDGTPLGILTRHDLLGRILLPQLPLSTPLGTVMSQPLLHLDASRPAHEAALLMLRHGLRHVPVTDAGRLCGMVSEHDLFALQRLSLQQLGTDIDLAADAAALQASAADIRSLAMQLLAQGVAPGSLTGLISHLNDRLTARAVGLTAAALGLALDAACWLGFGSEGREEQTLATDQDNGLVFTSADPDADPETDRPRWLALGQAVNQLLADCGYPLCSGGVMAGQRACCLSQAEWLARFAHWIEHGAPQDLLNATIFFDLRPLAGHAALAAPLAQAVTGRAQATPRFIRQMAGIALAHQPPLNWRGALDRHLIDLKLQGTALFVESARLLALANGIAATNTARRLTAAAAALGVPATEAEAWVAGFEHLQRLRLALPLRPLADPSRPNLCDTRRLNELDRRVLREALQQARRLQQRVALDHLRG